MTWFKVDDEFWHCKKVRLLGKDKTPLATWVLAGSWAADNLTDGFVPWEIIEQWDGKRRHASALIDVDLWEHAEHGRENGIQFHDWTDYQPTAEQVRAERAAAAERQRRARESRRKSRDSHAVTDTVTHDDSQTDSHFGNNGVSSPSPTRPDPTIEEPLRGSSAPKRKPAIPLPSDWQPTDKHRAYAAENSLDLDREVFKFRHHAEANDRRQASWNGAFSTWLANAVDFRPQPPTPGHHDPKTGRAVDW